MEFKYIDINDKNNKNIQRNLGIEILRFFLCFRVVLLHYYSSNNEYILSLKKNRFQVACFFFYFLLFFISNAFSKKYQKI